jgi:hypothetical protein
VGLLTGLQGVVEAPAGPGASAGWFTLLGGVGVIVGAVITAWGTAWREKVARREESQREALYALQNVLLEYRRSLERYKERGPTTKTTARVEDARGRVELTKYRILCEIVRTRVDNWRALAEGYFSGDPDVTLSQESKAWDQLHEDIGKELKRFG